MWERGKGDGSNLYRAHYSRTKGVKRESGVHFARVRQLLSYNLLH